MMEIKYNVLIGKRIVAKDMTLENAVIFLKGLFNEYYNDSMLSVTIEVSKENLSLNETLVGWEDEDPETFWSKNEEQ